MSKEKDRPHSDAEWYFRRDPERERFYQMFFSLCRKYNVRWASADETKKAFIEKETRATYERDLAERQGMSIETSLPPSTT